MPRRWRGADALLAGLPENRDLLLIAAISLRHLARIPEALATLDRAASSASRASASCIRSAASAMSRSRMRRGRSMRCCGR